MHVKLISQRQFSIHLQQDILVVGRNTQNA